MLFEDRMIANQKKGANITKKKITNFLEKKAIAKKSHPSSLEGRNNFL